MGSDFAFVIRFAILERLRGTAMEGCRPPVRLLDDTGRHRVRTCRKARQPETEAVRQAVRAHRHPYRSAQSRFDSNACARFELIP